MNQKKSYQEGAGIYNYKPVVNKTPCDQDRGTIWIILPRLLDHVKAIDAATPQTRSLYPIAPVRGHIIVKEPALEPLRTSPPIDLSQLAFKRMTMYESKTPAGRESERRPRSVGPGWTSNRCSAAPTCWHPPGDSP